MMRNFARLIPPLLIVAGFAAASRADPVQIRPGSNLLSNGTSYRGGAGYRTNGLWELQIEPSDREAAIDALLEVKVREYEILTPSGDQDQEERMVLRFRGGDPDPLEEALEGEGVRDFKLRFCAASICYDTDGRRSGRPTSNNRTSDWRERRKKAMEDSRERERTHETDENRDGNLEELPKRTLNRAIEPFRRIWNNLEETWEEITDSGDETESESDE